MALTKTRLNTIKKAETAIRELGSSRMAKADQERLHKVHQGLRVLDDEQMSLRNEVYRLVTIFEKVGDSRALTSGLKELLKPEVQVRTTEVTMAEVSRVHEGLTILLKYNPDATCDAQHDELYVEGVPPGEMRSDDAARLAELKWRYDSKLESWAFFT